MKDISESFGANQRAERKEYRAAKKDAFEKARDRGELKFDATTPLDSSFTSLTAATAANIFAKNKARRAVKRGFDKSYLASKKNQNANNASIGSTPTSGANSKNTVTSPSSSLKKMDENSVVKPKDPTLIPVPADVTAIKDTPVNTATKTVSNKPKSKGMGAAFSPERIAQYKAKGWAMDNTTHRNSSSKSSGMSTGEKNIQNRIKELEKTGEIKSKPNSSPKQVNKSTSAIANNPVQVIRENNPLRSLRDNIQSFKNSPSTPVTENSIIKKINTANPNFFSGTPFGRTPMGESILKKNKKQTKNG